MITHRTSATHRRRITHDLEVEFFRAYPELAQRIRQVRLQAPVRQHRLWRRLLRTVMVLLALCVLVWLAPRSAAAAADATFQFANDREALLLDTDVDIDVAGVRARVVITQTFHNQTALFQEGRYSFPLPPQAAVSELRIETGGRIIRGQVRRRDQAQTHYQQARDSGIEAALLEQHRANLFSIAVANISPNADILVKIGYVQRLEINDDYFELRLPLTLTPPYRFSRADGFPTMRFRSDRNATASISLTGRIDAGAPLQQVHSLHHPIQARSLPDGSWRLALLEQHAPSDRDFVLRWSPLHQVQPQVRLFREQRDEATYALLIVHPPAAEEDYLPRELIFVLDVSGSMAGTSLRQARAALNRGLDALSGQDYFNIITFSDSARALYPASVPAHPQTLSHAERAIAGLQAGGGTIMAPALAMAMSGNPPLQTIRQIVFITDGAVSNDRELIELVRANRNARLFAVGIGSAPNAHLLRELARAGGGSHVMVGTTAQVDGEMTALFDKLRRPVMSRINIDWPAGINVDVSPAVLPDLYAGEPLVVSAKLDQLTGFVAVQGDLGGVPWTTTVALDDYVPAQDIATLWARDKIRELSYVRHDLDPATRQERIIRLGLEHSLVTSFTSMIAVEEFPVRSHADGYASSTVANTLPFGSVRLGLPATATDARWQILVATVLFACSALLAFFYRRRW